MTDTHGNMEVRAGLSPGIDASFAAPALAAATSNLQPYDFRRPSVAGRTPASPRIGSLEPVYSAFASELSRALSNLVHLDVEISFSFIEQLRYDEFIASLSEISCVSVLRVDPPGAQACLDLSLPVVVPMIQRLLGGTGRVGDRVPSRALTQVEQGVALQIVEHAGGVLADCLGGWPGASERRAAGGFGGGDHGVGPDGAASLSIREESLESSPDRVRIMPGDEIVTAARFDVRLTGIGPGSETGGGRMSLCLPAPVIDCVRCGPTALPSPAQRQMEAASLTRNILDAAVELRALLAETKVRLSDVLTLQVGDIITTRQPAKDEVLLQLQGKQELTARIGQLGGARAVEITGTPWAEPALDTLDRASEGDPS